MALLTFNSRTYDSNDRIFFGKYKNQYTWAEVAKMDPSYLEWAVDNFLSDNTSLCEFINDLLSSSSKQKAITVSETLQLAEDQQAAVDMITQELINGEQRIFRLEGGAGYGKSYAVTAAVSNAIEAGYRISGMANSYVATQVMNQSLEMFGIEAVTIARALQLRPDYSTKKESYGESDDTSDALANLLKSSVERPSLVIVDEFSMVADSVVDLIYEGMGDFPHSKLLVVGDAKQLPSPEQQHICRFGGINPVATLSIPKRYKAGSPLHQLEQAVRDNAASLPHYLEMLADGKSIVKHDNNASMHEAMIEQLNDHPDEHGLILSFRRDKVAQNNRAMREAMLGSDAEEDLVNYEQLRVMRTTFMPITDSKDKMRFYSGTFLTAEDISAATMGISLPDGQLFEVNCWTTLTPEGFRIPLIFSLNENKADEETYGGEEYNALIAAVSEYCKEAGSWKFYHEVRSKFLQVAYGYATTVHRSQGASVDRIYMNIGDVMQGGYMMNALTYVAATRAKKQLHFVLP